MANEFLPNYYTSAVYCLQGTMQTKFIHEADNAANGLEGRHDIHLTSVIFASFVTSFLGLWEDKPQTADPMSLTWVRLSHTAASKLRG